MKNTAEGCVFHRLGKQKLDEIFFFFSTCLFENSVQSDLDASQSCVNVSL